jgi:hypothetical protein
LKWQPNPTVPKTNIYLWLDQIKKKYFLKVWSIERFAQTDLHPAVLKPDLYLSLREAQMVGDFNASPSSQIPVEVEFLHEGNGNFKKIPFSLMLYA